MADTSARPDRGTPATRADHRVLATAGHVDHGKSTLVRALTGMEPDRLAEEQRRGLTIDLGYAWTRLDPPPDATADAAPRTVAFVDVPGHERFVPTMLAGAGAVPVAMLVVAADGGWSAQTSEHCDVLDLLDVHVACLVVSRADLADEARLRDVQDDLRRRTAARSFADAPVVVTDAVSGRGLDELRAVLWHDLDTHAAPADVGRPRLWVDRCFTVAGAGTVVTGTLTGGTLHAGEDVEVLPLGRRTRVRGLQSLGTPVEAAGPGTRVAVNLAGLDHTEVARGDVVVAGGPWQLTDAVDVVVRVLPERTLARAGAWHLHVGSARTTCRVRPVEGPLIGPTSGVVRVLLDRPLPLVAGDRVVLRDAGPRVTVAGGRVADPLPGHRPRGSAERAAWLTALTAVADVAPGGRGAAVDRLRALLMLRGGSGNAEQLRAAAGLPADAPLPADVHAVGAALVDAEALARWDAAVRGLGTGTHDARTVAATVTQLGVHPDAAAGSADHLVAQGVLARVAGGYALAEQADAVAVARARRADAVVAALLVEPFAPPDLDEVARAHGLDHREVAALVASGAVVRCGKVAFAREAIENAVVRLREVRGEAGVTAAQAKDAWGTSRRYAIPLLEHLRRTGVTRFDGQLHRLVGHVERGR